MTNDFVHTTVRVGLFDPDRGRRGRSDRDRARREGGDLSFASNSWSTFSARRLRPRFSRSFLLLFGLGDFAKIAVAAFAAWLVIVFNVAYGVMNARQTRILAARSMGASSLRIFKDVIFFETLPQTFVGLRTAVSLALVVIIVAEMFIGATDGIGHRIIDAQISYSLTDMYGSILIAGAMGYGLNLALLLIERSLVHWSGK